MEHFARVVGLRRAFIAVTFAIEAVDSSILGRNLRDGALEEGCKSVELRSCVVVVLDAGFGQTVEHGGENKFGGSDDESGQYGCDLEGGEDAGCGDEWWLCVGLLVGEKLGIGDDGGAVGRR